MLYPTGMCSSSLAEVYFCRGAFHLLRPCIAFSPVSRPPISVFSRLVIVADALRRNLILGGPRVGAWRFLARCEGLLGKADRLVGASFEMVAFSLFSFTDSSPLFLIVTGSIQYDSVAALRRLPFLRLCTALDCFFMTIVCWSFCSLIPVSGLTGVLLFDFGVV